MLTESCQISPQAKTLEKQLLLRAKLEQLTGLLGIQSLQARQRQNELNDAAAGATLRRQMFGEQDQGEAEVQGSTILGDVHYPAPVIVQQPAAAPSSGGVLKAILLTALSIAVPGAGAAGWLVKELIDKAPAAIATPLPTPVGTIAENNPQPTQPGMDMQLLQVEDLSP